MTNDKMPNVIFASELGGWGTTPRDLRHGPPFPKYLRAESVMDLLKQARDAMRSGNHSWIIGAADAIDKFLEETK